MLYIRMREINRNNFHFERKYFALHAESNLWTYALR
jgi:hypothetical protein